MEAAGNKLEEKRSCVLLVVQVTNDALTTIFGTILGWHLDTGGFSADVKNLSSNIIAATLSIYSQAVASLLPTPAKSHYTFNLRDFARVIQVGMHAEAVLKPCQPMAMERLPQRVGIVTGFKPEALCLPLQSAP